MALALQFQLLPHRGTLRPKKHGTTGANDLSCARLDQIINIKREPVQPAGMAGVQKSLAAFADRRSVG
jgi:hypothetical protein